ncbi:MAG: histidine phosphatase family protein [Polyangiales bacterium]|jgi:phosphohistidine phosphatase
MNLLLIRHGEAVDDSDGQGDGARWLTAKGRRVTREVAAHVAKHHPPSVVVTSPLVRATQTAEIVAGALGLEGGVVVDSNLASGDVAGVLRSLAQHRGHGTVAAVGHEPTLSILVQRLLEDHRWPGFEKSGVCALKWHADGRAHFQWALLPKKLRVVDDLAKFHE